MIFGVARAAPLYVSMMATCAFSRLAKTCDSKDTAVLRVSWRWITRSNTASLFGRSDTEKVPALASPTLNSILSPGFRFGERSPHCLYGIGDVVSFVVPRNTSRGE